MDVARTDPAHRAGCGERGSRGYKGPVRDRPGLRGMIVFSCQFTPVISWNGPAWGSRVSGPEIFLYPCDPPTPLWFSGSSGPEFSPVICVLQGSWVRGGRVGTQFFSAGSRAPVVSGRGSAMIRPIDFPAAGIPKYIFISQATYELIDHERRCSGGAE